MMLIVETSEISNGVLKAVVGYSKFIKNYGDGVESFIELHDKMIEEHGDSNVKVAGYDISSDQYYILMVSERVGFYIFGCLIDDGCLRRISEGVVQSIRETVATKKPFEETEFEEEEDGIPQVDEIE